MVASRTVRLLAVALGAALLAVACGDDSGSGGDEALTYDQIQVLGSHNSYHLKPDPEVLAGVAAVSQQLADETEYGHEPIDVQLDEYGIRQFELDVFADPDGGLYANRKALPVIGLPEESGEPALDEPGYKVLHVQDYDFETTCLTLIDCLDVFKGWSDDNPDHLPLLIMVEGKADNLADAAAEGGVSLADVPVDFTVPLEYTPELYDDLEAEITSVFPEDRIYTPDELRGDHDTLSDAVAEDGWPAIDDLRGQIVFVLLDTGEERDVYRGDVADTLEGRLLFTSADPGDPDAAFLRVDDPIEDGELIRELVADGFLVRTRTDVPTEQARSGDTTMLEAALASGAQFLSTDFYRSDPSLGSDYTAALPGGVIVRCNPVSAPDDCTDEDIPG